MCNGCEEASSTRKQGNRRGKWTVHGHIGKGWRGVLTDDKLDLVICRVPARAEGGVRANGDAINPKRWGRDRMESEEEIFQLRRRGAGGMEVRALDGEVGNASKLRESCQGKKKGNEGCNLQVVKFA